MYIYIYYIYIYVYIALRKALDTREDKTVLTDSLIELAKCVLKNNIFEHNTSFL